MNTPQANSIEPLMDSRMCSIPVQGIGKNFLALHATRNPTFYSSFIPPVLFGQTTGSVFAVPKYSTLIGCTFKGYLGMDLSLLLFTEVGNDNTYRNLENYL